MQSEPVSESWDVSNPRLLGAASARTGSGSWNGIERRHATDRRAFSLRTVFGGGWYTRRRHGRRAADHALPIVDWHDAHLLAVAMTILVLCSADAWLTLMLLTRGATEANPMMARLIEWDVTTFTAAKMAMTGLGVVMLVLLGRVQLAGPLRAWHLLYAVMAGYAWLIAYELQMLALLG